MHRKLFSSYFYILLQRYTCFMILQGVSNLWNMPKLDQLKCDFSALSLAATSLSFSPPLPLSLTLCLSCTTQFSSANVFIKWQSSGFNYYNLSGSIKTHKKERKRKREKGREREVSNWAALLKWPQVPSSSNTNNKPSRAGEKGAGWWVATTCGCGKNRRWLKSRNSSSSTTITTTAC